MTLIIIETAAALLLLITALIIAIRSLTKSPKKSSFLMTKDDISNNMRSLMLSVNRSEYVYGYRSEAEYTKFIQDIDNSLMRG